MKRTYAALLAFIVGALAALGFALAYQYVLSQTGPDLEFPFPPYNSTTGIWLENGSTRHIRACVLIDGNTFMFADLPGKSFFSPPAGVRSGLMLEPGNHEVKVLGNGQEIGRTTLFQGDGLTNDLSIYLDRTKGSGDITCRIQNRTNVYGGM